MCSNLLPSSIDYEGSRETLESSHGYLTNEDTTLLNRAKGGVCSSPELVTRFEGDRRKLYSDGYLEVESREYFSDELTDFLRLTRGSAWSDDQLEE